MKPAEIRTKSVSELKKMEADLRDELFRLQLKKTMGQLEKSHRLKEIRKDIARLLTIKKQSLSQPST